MKQWRNSKIEFAITNHCNAKCPLCIHTHMYNDGTLNLQHADFNSFENVVKKYTNKTQLVALCGDFGDPLMHPRIQDYIDCTERYNIQLIIHTNGGLRTAKFFEHNAKNENLEICFSIDGTSQQTNEKYRVNVDYNKAMNNMLAFKTNGGNASWDFIIFDYNIDDFYEALQIAKNYDIKFQPIINNREWEHKIKDRNLIEELKLVLKQHKHGNFLQSLETLKVQQR